MNSPKRGASFAPKYYNPNHYEFSRRSRLPEHYFDPWWKRPEAMDMLVGIACAVLAVVVVVLVLLGAVR